MVIWEFFFHSIQFNKFALSSSHAPELSVVVDKDTTHVLKELGNLGFPWWRSG